MEYFTDASTKGKVRYNQFPSAIGVRKSPESNEPIGSAFQFGRTEKGLALWKLTVGKTDVPGGFIIVEGRFVLSDSGIR
jgi:hypothetical protein